jgi:lipopolysaccharide transport system permease protein
MPNGGDRRRFQHALDLTLALIEREVKVQYKATAVGFLWALAGPLLQLAVYSFLFSRVLTLDIPNYHLFVFPGILAWTWFQASVNQSAICITSQPELIRQPTFRPLVLPIVTVGGTLLNYLMALPLFFVAAVLSGFAIHLSALLLPLLLVIQFCLTAGLGYLLAALNVVFRDTQRIVQVLLQLAMFLTPVFYSAKSVPEEWVFLYSINPMSVMIGAYRDVLYFGRTPDVLPLVLVSGVSLVMLVSGKRYFERMRGRFVEET